MRSFIDMTGQRYGRLTVIGRAPNPTRPRKRGWLVRCDCGNEKIVDGSHLRSGVTRSCGCLRNENIVVNHRNAISQRLTPADPMWDPYNPFLSLSTTRRLLEEYRGRAGDGRLCDRCGKAPATGWQYLLNDPQERYGVIRAGEVNLYSPDIGMYDAMCGPCRIEYRNEMTRLLL